MGAVGWSDLEARGLAAGLDVVAVTTADPFVDARRVLEERREAGLNGSMQFTYRNPARSTEPDRALPGVETIIAGATSYHREPPDRPAGAGPVARVARYVWGDDQDRLLAGLQAMCDLLVDAGHRACVVSDQNHLVDRAVAERAGLGWFGKNANLLLPGRGSWYLLGSVLTDATVVDAPTLPTVDDGCGTCDRCRPACPTGAIVAPGTIDARRCLSWSLQSTGSFPRDQRIALGDRLYGCDDCQEVCPPNRLELRRAAPGGSGTSAAIGRQDRAWVPLLDLLASSDDELLAAHGRWYIADRDPQYLRRNALVVLGNVGDGADPGVRAALATALRSAHSVVRSHAVWSARRLGCDDLLVDVMHDPDLDVQAELAAPTAERAPS